VLNNHVVSMVINLSQGSPTSSLQNCETVGWNSSMVSVASAMWFSGLYIGFVGYFDTPVSTESSVLP